MSRQRKWLKEYLEDQSEARWTEKEYKQAKKSATQTLPTGLSFRELNRGRMLAGDLPVPDADNLSIPEISERIGIGANGKLRIVQIEKEFETLLETVSNVFDHEEIID